MSDSEDASHQLALELQKAVDDVNNIASDAASHSKKKRKKKRSRETQDAVDNAEEPARKKSKKSKKKHDEIQEIQEHHSDTEFNNLIQYEPVDEPSVAVEPQEKEKRKKKKKKDKGKHRAVDEPVPADPSSEHRATGVDSDTFVSVILAAASSQAVESHPGEPPVEPSTTGYPPLSSPPPPHFSYPGQYVPYPNQSGMPFVPPPAPFDHTPQGQPIFPDFSSLALPDLVNASNDDILRGLQNLDMEKIANLVKSLGEMANISLSAPPSFVHNPAPPGPTPVRQVPARSDAILGRPPKQTKAPGQAKPTKVLPPNLPPPSQEDINPEHAHMLANTWMNATKLAEVARKEGIVYKKGKFSAIEEAQLNTAIETYRTQKGLTKEQLQEVIFSKEKGRDSFWQEITSALHMRPIIAVYHHVRRAYHPLAQQGRWMPAEDNALRKAFAEHGAQWEKISNVVGRASGDCRDRYRNHIEHRDQRQNGAWTKEEEEELTKIVLEMTIEQGKDIDNDVFWGIVSQRMGNRRGRQQVRIKWTDSLSNQFKNRGQKPRWSQMDSYLLVHKVASLNVRDDSEVDWKQLPDENWNVWSAHQLQRRWKTLKDSIKDSKHMTHAEIMEILKNKKAQSPPPPTKKKGKAATSAEVIDDSDDEGGAPAAGSSSGPGTVAAIVHA